jgi:hypothetical protein
MYKPFVKEEVGPLNLQRDGEKARQNKKKQERKKEELRERKIKGARTKEWNKETIKYKINEDTRHMKMN